MGLSAEKGKKMNRGVGSGWEEVAILVSHGRADGAAFIGQTYKPNQRKKARGSHGSRQRGSNHGVMLHEEGQPGSRMDR